MKEVDRWLLPDGIEEMLPAEAMQIEALRRRLVDQFKRWGYDYVIPPMLEFTDSLLTGSGEDISLLTFKLTDQLSGKMLGLRADITPQVARMDAHSLKRDGVSRFCYAGHVAHTRPKEALSSRTPIQVGIELFGEPGLQADIEVISLLLSTLEESGLPEQYIDLGHVQIYRALSRYAGLTKVQEDALFELLQAKAMTDIDYWIDRELGESLAASWLRELATLSGGKEVLDKASSIYADAPEDVARAIHELKTIEQTLSQRFPDAKLYFDLSELRGYHYLNGIVFGAFAPGVGTAIGNGGRYDHVGEAFGRARPATGFAVDLTVVQRLLECVESTQPGIFAPHSSDPAQWQEITRLRQAGERVVCGFEGQSEATSYQACDRILVAQKGSFVVESNISK